MAWAPKLRKKPAKAEVSETQEQAELIPAKTRPNHLGARLLVGAVYTAGALTFGMSGLALVAAASANSTPQAVVSVPNTTTAEGTAVAYVTAWLTATREDQTLLQPYLNGRPVHQLPEQALAVRDVAVSSVEQTDDPAIVSVTVSAHVEQRTVSEGEREGKPTRAPLTQRTTPTASPSGSGSAEPTPTPSATAASSSAITYQLRYYQVAVRESAGRVQVIGFPTPTPGPATGDPIELAYPHRILGTTDLGSTMEGFLQAYAAGKSDVSRYLAPDLALRAIEPAPYAQLHITDLRVSQKIEDVPSGQPVRVLIQAEAELPDARKSRQGVTVPVTVTKRDDRWEVTSLDPAPAIAAEPSASPKPTS